MKFISLKSLLFLLLLAGSLPILVLTIKWQTRLRGKAAVVAKVAAPRGVAGDLWADVVFGKNDFNQAGPNEVVPYRVFNPGGLVVDRQKSPNTIFVYDGANSRILGYQSLGTCRETGNACTTHSNCPGTQCVFTQNKPADIVLGQPGGTGYSACNGDGNMENFPARKPASDASLCSIPEIQVSPQEGGSFANMALDAQSNLYVTDFFNNRVLKFIDPFTTDKVADAVWGQDDFSGNNCNRSDADATHPYGVTPTPPNASSLCLGIISHGPTHVAGVDIDASGNLWVADSSNHRVLRFPNKTGTPEKTADLVLGQADFTSRNPGSGLSQMHAPAAVRVYPATGRVYVADLDNNRILTFDPPFTNGMAASGTFANDLKSPAGIIVDPAGEGIWVEDYGNHMLELWNNEGTTVKKVLFKDVYQPNGLCGSTTPYVYDTCVNPQPGGACWVNLCETRGSFDVDGDGNLFVSSTGYAQDVWRYPFPIPTPARGQVYSADWRLFSPQRGGPNMESSRGLFSPRGIVIKNNQIIVSDGHKVVFWNDPSQLTNGKPADGYVSANSFFEPNEWAIGRIAADDNNLWVIRKGTVDVYRLPLVSGATPIKKAVISFDKPLPVLGGGSIQWEEDSDFWGIDIDSSAQYLWLTQASDKIHRVFRVRNPLTQPLVDVVLGHASLSETSCNRNPALDNYEGTLNPTSAAPNTLCKPGAVKLDRGGNVWVSDYSLEFHGNQRLLMFDAALFSSITNNALLGPNATLVAPNMRIWQPAFDSQNRMVVGYDGQMNHPNAFPGLFVNPQSKLATTTAPDATLKDVFSHGYTAAFDENDNLYIADLNRGRVLFYKQPFAKIVPSPTPTPKPSTTIDDTNPAITYQGNWHFYQGTQYPFFNNTVHYSNQTGASASFQSSADFITYIYDTYSNRGIVEISINGVKVQEIDAYAPTLTTQRSWTFLNPIPGMINTVTITATNRKNPSATDVYATLDGFIVAVTAGSPTPTPTPAPTPTPPPPPAVLSAGTYNENHSAIRYVGGWINYTDSRAYGGTLIYSDKVGNFAGFSVSGTQLGITFTGHPNRGNLSVVIDSDIYTVSETRPDLAWQETWFSPLIAPGTHSVTLSHPQSSTGKYVDVDAIVVRDVATTPTLAPTMTPTPTPTTAPIPPGTYYDDSHATLSYTGAWISWNGTGAYNDSLHYANQPGSAVSAVVGGNTVTYVFTKAYNRGIAEIFIDGTKVDEVDGYDPAILWQQKKTYTLPSGASHTIAITASGRKNASATDTYVDLDGLEIN